MKIKNNLVSGITNSDVAWRLLPNGTMVDCINFFVTTTGGSDVGLGKNPLGNALVINNNFLGGKSYGVGSDSSNNKIYYFVKAINYDYLIEYDVITDINVILLQSSTGTRLNLKENKRIINIDIYIDPEGNGNLIQWSGDDNPPRIGNIERMKTWGIDGFTAEEILLIKAPPVYSPKLTPVISSENSQANYLENKFISFATRFKYKDGYYSAISSYSEYFFKPNLYELDYDTFENKGMINVYNAVNISFNTGEREVVAIDLLFKLSKETDIYKIDAFVKEDEGWSDNSIQFIKFNNSKIYAILPKDQYFRSFDNVPEKVLAQTSIGNRVCFANYLENKNLIDKNNNKVIMDYTLNLISKNITEKFPTITESNKLYNFDSIPTTVLKGQINLDFTDYEFKKNNSIYFNFKLRSTVQNINFTATYIFTLDKDYNNLTDLIDNSTLSIQLNNYTSYLESNNGVIPPDNYLPPYIVLKGFEVLNVGNIMSVNFPCIKYEIDNSPSSNTFIRDYFYNDFSTIVYRYIGDNSSLKSFRSYEIGMIYRDLQCRKTTVLTSEKNTLFIKNENAITKNIIEVIIPFTQKPPTWAHTYKFAIKINQSNYQTIPINIFFEDGIFRWIKIDGENKGKLSEGDILIVKKDGTGFLKDPVKTKVLALELKDKNFLSENAVEIVEPAGLYAKIKAGNFEMRYSTNEFIHFSGYDESIEVSVPAKAGLGPFLSTTNLGARIDTVFTIGSTVSLSFRSDFANEDPRILFNKTYTAQRTYRNFEEFYNAQMLPLGFQSTSHPDRFYNVFVGTGNVTVGGEIGIVMIVEGTERGSFTDFGIKRGRVYVDADIRIVDGLFIFENTAKEINNDIFYETPEIFNVVNGEHEFTNHVLDKTFNCFVQGNGVESYQIRDAFNENEISIDFSPTAISEDEYKQINRYADITYSGIYNSNANVNRLNEFNLYLANFKDDVEKSYGYIYKIKGKDTNLEVFQENRISNILYGKNVLTNADGTQQITQTEDVLGQQNTYQSENGISFHPESFDYETINEYFTDTKRGVVCKKSNNGIFEISQQGHKNYFRKLFKENKINNIIGAYDQYNDIYYLNIKYNDIDYVTWVYSDNDNGWLGKVNFNPDDMIRLNNEFISFKDGNVYKGNESKNGILNNYNTFFETQYPSTFSYVVNEEPSIRKIHKTISSESTDAWDILAETELNKGYINKEDFLKEEGVYYGYLRSENENLDTALVGSYQGIGNCIINGLTLLFNFELESEISIGDDIRDENMNLVGTILNKTNNTLNLNTINNINNGDYVVCCKPQSIENNHLRGHSMLVTATLDTNKKTEVFALGCEIQISNPT